MVSKNVMVGMGAVIGTLAISGIIYLITRKPVDVIPEEQIELPYQPPLIVHPQPGGMFNKNVMGW